MAIGKISASMLARLVQERVERAEAEPPSQQRNDGGQASSPYLPPMRHPDQPPAPQAAQRIDAPPARHSSPPGIPPQAPPGAYSHFTRASPPAMRALPPSQPVPPAPRLPHGFHPAHSQMFQQHAAMLAAKNNAPRSMIPPQGFPQYQVRRDAPRQAPAPHLPQPGQHNPPQQPHNLYMQYMRRRQEQR